MATLLRSTCRSARQLILTSTYRAKFVTPMCRCIQTSKKKETSTPTPAREAKETEDEYRKRLEKWFSDSSPDSEKNYIFQGYDIHDRKMDVFVHKWIMFWTISAFVFVSAVYTYAPDKQNADWGYREAYFELERREKLGLPLIDKNVVDPSRVTLPSEEEIGDTPIYV